MRQRSSYPKSFKAQVVQECLQPGASISSVAISHGINANVIRKWLPLFRDQPPTTLPAFVPVKVAPKRQAESSVIIELPFGEQIITVKWPSSDPEGCVRFRTQWQAQQFVEQLRERLARFGLSLNASKTRLIEFGRFAARNRRKRGLGKPETFDFLGFTHCCSTNRSGGFQILRLTVKKRMRATLLAIRDELKRRRHEPVRVVGQWLNRVVSGYFNYHAVPGNLIRLGGFRLAVCRLWRQALKRRSQRHRLQWSRYGRLADLYIPRPRNAHPYPEDRFASRTQGRSRMR